MTDPHRFAAWVSQEARAQFPAVIGATAPADLAGRRRHYDAFNEQHLRVALDHYQVEIAEQFVGGVRIHVVVPAGGATDPRALICLHGGAFMWGAGAGALLEAVPVAATTGMQVIAVDYRLAPEHVFPAAVDDVLGVYSSLLSQQGHESVGMYGCSAGGMLTAQLMARLSSAQVPMPGAIAMLHGTGLEFEGDSAYFAHAYDPRPGSGAAPALADFPYLAGADQNDPLVLPGHHAGVLAKFPPCLLVTGTRDFAASSVAVMHRRLLAAGIEADFVMFDGMWHAHHMDVTLPESRETFALLGRFFRRHLA
jgi:acetyl esterase/lipase